jgi:polyisoprenoid-binding protein YceI
MATGFSMMRTRAAGVTILVAWLLAHVLADGAPGPQVFKIDPANSHVLIRVGKTGIFGFAGHTHEVVAPDVEGQVDIDQKNWTRSSVSLEFQTAALEVSAQGESPNDVSSIQQTMRGEQVLDVKRFPSVVFKSRRVTTTSQSPNGKDVAIEGDLTLHGVTRPLTIHAITTLQPPDVLTATGTFVIRQTDFGIHPVTVAGGAVKVKNDLDVEFVLQARRSGPTAAAGAQ